MYEGLKIAKINGQEIVVGGIGKLFYEDGFPIHITVDVLKERGITVSVLHIADELYKNGWSKRAIVNTLKQDFEWCGQEVSKFVDVGMYGTRQAGSPGPGLEWLYSVDGYENQREMLFQSLYGFSTEDCRNDKVKQQQISEVLSDI